MRWLRPDRQGRADARLQEIRIFTAALELRGFVAPSGQRITDILLRGQDLAFLPQGAEEKPENWVMVAPSDILVVVPPPLPSRATLRTRSTLHRVFVNLDPYRVTGTAHLSQGDELDGAFRDRQQFLALTKANVEIGGEVANLDVAIVNLGASTAFGVLPER